MKIRVTIQLNDCSVQEAQASYDNICNRLRGVPDMEVHSHYVEDLENGNRDIPEPLSEPEPT